MKKTTRTLTPRQTVFLKRLDEAHSRLRRAVAGLDRAVLCTERIAGRWTAKDILGHVVSWNDEFRADIREILRGRHPGYDRRISQEREFRRWNQIQAARKRDWSWRRIIADLGRDRREAARLIRSLQPADFLRRGVTPWKRPAGSKRPAPAKAGTDSILTLVAYHWMHMNDHAGMLERWRKRRAG
jgi:hypothetical protein